MKNASQRMTASLSLLGLALGIALAIQLGAVSITGADWLAVLTAHDDAPLKGSAYVLWNIRVPRALCAVLIGAALGVSGALTQGLFRNPLADPGLLGVTSGAACAAALTIVVFAGMQLSIPIEWRIWVLPMASFLGAFAVCLTLDRVARWLIPGSIAGLLLTGIALNALAMAVMGLCTYLATDEQLRSLSFWTLGSVAGTNWSHAALLTVILVFALLRIQRLLNPLNALALGESTAGHLGINITQLRTEIILLVALLSGISIAWCGLIGFIGLIAPHIVRTWLGSNQKHVVPFSAVVGAGLLLLADTVARTIAIPAEIPVGIFTALLGAPFFLVLLNRARHKMI